MQLPEEQRERREWWRCGETAVASWDSGKKSIQRIGVKRVQGELCDYRMPFSGGESISAVS